MVELFFAPGTCSLASMAALEHAGIVYQPIAVDLRGNRDGLKAVSPEGRVPVLVADGEALTETIAILWWVASRAGDDMLPTGPDAVRCLSIMGWLASRLHILRRQFARPANFSPSVEAQATIAAAALPGYAEGLARLAALVAAGGCRSFILRCYVLVFYHWARADGMLGSDHLALSDLARAMWTLPGVQLAAKRHGLDPVE